MNTNGSDGVHLYVDLSNVFMGAKGMAQDQGDPVAALRLSAERLKAVMAAGRSVVSASLVANDRVPGVVLRHFEASFQVETVELGATSGREQAADQMLQNRLLLGLMHQRPGVVVLATGDGAGWSRGCGFAPALVSARRFGFGVEVVAFRASLNPTLRRLAEICGVAVELDPYYKAITFLEGLRFPEPLNLTHRPTASPGLWSADEAAAVLDLVGSNPHGRAA